MVVGRIPGRLSQRGVGSGGRCDALLIRSTALPNRTAAENVLLCGMPDRQLFSGTCPDLGELVKISR